MPVSTQLFMYQVLFYTEALGINNAGQVVGTYNNGVSNIGFLYSSGVYTAINPPASIDSVAVAINDSGDIIGDYSKSANSESGFLYSNGSYTTLNIPGVVAVQDINDAGQIVGEVSADSSSQFHAFLYGDGGSVTIEPPANSNYSYAKGINLSGEVVGTYSPSNVTPPPGY